MTAQLPALPALPADPMDMIARATLRAEYSTPEAWARLSLVCRRWREVLRGVHPGTSNGCARAFATHVAFASVASWNGCMLS